MQTKKGWYLDKKAVPKQRKEVASDNPNRPSIYYNSENSRGLFMKALFKAIGIGSGSNQDINLESNSLKAIRPQIYKDEENADNQLEYIEKDADDLESDNNDQNLGLADSLFGSSHQVE